MCVRKMFETFWEKSANLVTFSGRDGVGGVGLCAGVPTLSIVPILYNTPTTISVTLLLLSVTKCSFYDPRLVQHPSERREEERGGGGGRERHLRSGVGVGGPEGGVEVGEQGELVAELR